MSESTVTSTVDIPPVSLSDIIISDELLRRPLRMANTAGENSALQSLAAALAEGTDSVLQRLAGLAVDLCRAGSAGVSVLEEGDGGEWLFRWRVLAGVFEPFQGGSTPRHWSPCGTCMDAGIPVLFSHPERYFTYFQEVKTPLVEGLVIPMYTDGNGGATIWILSHTENRRFDAEDVRIMTTLGNFASRALSLAPAAGSLQDEPSHELRSYREHIWSGYVQRISNGDHAALTSLFNETSPLVFATALRVLGFRADAEEITGDVYARLWRIAHCYDCHRGSVVGWLRTIARNLSFDRLRSQAMRSRREVALSSEYASGFDLETQLIAGQANTRIRAALEALPFEQRRAIELAYFAGLTAAEVAAEVGRPIGTVKTRIRLALQKLRRILAVAAK